MSLKPFTYPFPETRFLHAGSSVYKFKIRYGKSIRGEDTEDKEVISQASGFFPKVQTERKAAGAMMKKRKCIEAPSSPSRPGLARAQMGASSQSPSKKKPPLETRRVSTKMEASRLLAETPAFDISDVQVQDSKWEDSLAGQIIPPSQQNNPPSPKGPTELGTSGFFGLLSSLFPFRYFFRKNSQ
ncbi:membrane-anchored junction protein [Pteropus alecto]|uniref:membrane-anchored junction protein n=1 Tax=Pteropus alecto TaxID=9402 RepID=UPI00076894C2|nr:membrane-anchored junction protein [Pteropus alecto]